MRSIWLLLTRLPLPVLVLSSCGSPPKPPTVDESQKRPANSAMAVELQTCKSNLQSTRIVATESWRLAESNAANLERVSARQQVIATMASAQMANSVFTIHFDFGSTRVVVPADIASTLIESARAAPLVLLRGRTDGTTESFAESRVARERATAVRDYLVAAGVDPKRIRGTYQPVGDHAADNTSAAGRDMNRRVEIEVYRALPLAMGAVPVALP
ncbi:MAG: OmpA family protein [Burkholderiaceae bacterium]|nr:OmpA family protein [Burkholderiaceae bacterium]